MACTGLNALNPICQVQDVPRQLTQDAFSQIAGWFGQAASIAVRGLWASIDSATTIDLDSPQLATDMVATSAIAGVLCLGLFAIQVITTVLRREPGGLARAVRGLFVAMVGSAFALTTTKILLSAVDALSAGVVAYAMDTNMAGLGQQLALVNLAYAGRNPAVVLLLSLVVLAAVVVVWAAMMLRKLMIILAAVMAPLAFSGATADITRSWVRRWIEFTAAMIASKLLLVIILMVGVSVLQGAGHSPDAGPGQDITQLATGALILLMGGFAPWIAIKMFHFAGDTLHTAHAHAAQAPAGARTVIAAPQKVNALHSQASSAASKLGRAHAGGTSAGPRTSSQPPVGSPGTTNDAPSAPPRMPANTGTGTAGPGAGAATGGPAAVGAAGTAATAAAAPVLVAGGAVETARQVGHSAAAAAEKATPPPPAPELPGRPPHKALTGLATDHG